MLKIILVTISVFLIACSKTPANQAEFRFGIQGGSLLEINDEQGLTHFIEHMAFNGTRHFNQKQLLDFFRDNGMSFGPDLNATTDFTQTIYRFSLPTQKQETIEKGLLLLKDWATNILFDETEVNKERGIILEEFRARKSLDKRIRDKVGPLVYGDDYLNRHPLGKKNIIKTVSHAKLKETYNKWYQPERMMVVVVGDIDVDRMETNIISTFSEINNNAIRIQRAIVCLFDFRINLGF